MSQSYLLIASRDPFASAEVERFYDLGVSLQRDGAAVTLFLLQNGVLPARRGVRSDALSRVAQSGVRVLADEFSLRERGIARQRLVAGVTAAPLERVLDALEGGAKALWQ